MKKIQLFTLQTQPWPQEIACLRELCTRCFDGEPPPTVAALTAEALLENLATFLRRRDVFVIAAEPAQFNLLKGALLHALGYASHVRAHVLDMQLAPTPEDAAFPVGAKAFLSPDGLLNGFALHCGNQEIVVLPLCLDRLEQQRRQIYAYLTRDQGMQDIAAMPDATPRRQRMRALAATGLTAAVLLSGAALTTQFATTRAETPVVEYAVELPQAFAQPARQHVEDVVNMLGNAFNRPSIISPPGQQQPVAQGTFQFQVAGFGHGVGMSQEGAMEFARRGWTYRQILQHYYYAPGIRIAQHANPPAFVTHEGRQFALDEYIARIAWREIGHSGNVPNEAMRAQMIAAYTIAKRNNFRTTEVNHHILSDAEWNSGFAQQFHAPMLALANSVRGTYVSHNGSVADALYFASSAGHTASAQWAWNGASPSPYLRGGRMSPEVVDRSSPSFTTQEIRRMVDDYNRRFPGNAITLCNNAAQWFEVLSTCAHGYVEQVRIGDRIFTGGNARMNFFGSRTVRSHHFTVNFILG
ncbi:MAG: hypothetical protein FWE40_07470 [Oscillospiraceae bacterium]|nr:hypothetical protein [Oscillospiraceae bacterium]